MSARPWKINTQNTIMRYVGIPIVDDKPNNKASIKPIAQIRCDNRRQSHPSLEYPKDYRDFYRALEALHV